MPYTVRLICPQEEPKEELVKLVENQPYGKFPRVDFLSKEFSKFERALLRTDLIQIKFPYLKDDRLLEHCFQVKSLDAYFAFTQNTQVIDGEKIKDYGILIFGEKKYLPQLDRLITSLLQKYEQRQIPKVDVGFDIIGEINHESSAPKTIRPTPPQPPQPLTTEELFGDLNEMEAPTNPRIRLDHDIFGEEEADWFKED